MRLKNNNRGQVLTYFLAVIFLIFFTGSIFLFLLYRDGMFRFEFGLEEKTTEELVFDKNRVLELFKREEIVAQKEKKLFIEKERIDNLRKQIEIEKNSLMKDKEAINKTMQNISSKFTELSDDEEKKMQQLADLYAKMKTQKVAVIFNAMNVQTVATLLMRMQNKVSAKILGEIGVKDAERAVKISDIIKGRFKRESFEKIPNS